MAAVDLPILIVGDVHGDIERLVAALKPYPAEEWRTIFLGDLVDYGMFGVGVMRLARDRPNTDVLLGNHEVAMLSALRDPSRVGFYISIGGQQHDLDELRKDELLQGWMQARPLILKLEDNTLVQHCGNDYSSSPKRLRCRRGRQCQCIHSERGVVARSDRCR